MCAIVTVIAGLASRKLGPHLPRVIAEYAGDALYATLMVFLVALASTLVVSGPRVRLPSWALAVAGFGISALVEVSQLSHAAVLEAVRATTLGRLVLGTTFVWSDFPCYAAGALLGAGIDRVVSVAASARSEATGPRAEPGAPRPPPPP